MLKRIVRGGSLLLVGEGAVQVSGLLRNILVARSISPDDFGIASALAMSVSLVEMLSDLGSGRYLTRSGFDEPARWLASAHMLALIRGVIGALALLVIGWPLAALLRMQEGAWAFQAMALVPLLRSVMHHGIWQEQSELRYRGFVVTQAGPQIITLLLAWPLAVVLPDFRCMLALVLIGAALAAVASHLVASGPWRVAFDMHRLRAMATYGFPLLADGLLMTVVMHGERIAIGNRFGPTALGIYATALLVAWTPAAVAGRIGLSLGVPVVGRAADPVRVMAGLGLASGAGGLALACALGVGSSDLIRIVFGSGYAPTPLFFSVIVATYAIRVLRTMPIVVSLGTGHTGTVAMSNLIRAGGLAVGIGLLWFRSDPVSLLVGSLLGEAAALLWHVAVLPSVPRRVVLAMALWCGACAGVAFAGPRLTDALGIGGVWAVVGGIGAATLPLAGAALAAIRSTRGPAGAMGVASAGR